MKSIFDLASTASLFFGAGKRTLLPKLLAGYGKRILLVRGGSSFDTSGFGKEIVRSLEEAGFDIHQCTIASEPTPAMIDIAVEESGHDVPSAVLAIGGGSVLDAGKAISAMLPLRQPVRDFLEGVGNRSHPGRKIPFVAVPTTAGTGSEATKNAVLSEVGENGFKRSLRHNNFVPDAAIVDPELTISLPGNVTAASGMDAFTQLLESYVSTNANPVTDALALEGLALIGRSLIKTYESPADVNARTDMSLAAYLSGVTLANAGLGLVHGYASSVGGRYNIPHGVICSGVMYASNVVTVRKLSNEGRNESLKKFALAGQAVSGVSGRSSEYLIDALLVFIKTSASQMRIPTLFSEGVQEKDVNAIAAVTDEKYNPVKLSTDEKREVLMMS